MGSYLKNICLSHTYRYPLRSSTMGIFSNLLRDPNRPVEVSNRDAFVSLLRKVNAGCMKALSDLGVPLNPEMFIFSQFLTYHAAFSSNIPDQAIVMSIISDDAFVVDVFGVKALNDLRLVRPSRFIEYEPDWYNIRFGLDNIFADARHRIYEEKANSLDVYLGFPETVAIQVQSMMTMMLVLNQQLDQYAPSLFVKYKSKSWGKLVDSL